MEGNLKKYQTILPKNGLSILKNGNFEINHSDPPAVTDTDLKHKVEENPAMNTWKFSEELPASKNTIHKTITFIKKIPTHRETLELICNPMNLKMNIALINPNSFNSWWVLKMSLLQLVHCLIYDEWCYD